MIDATADPQFVHPVSPLSLFSSTSASSVLGDTRAEIIINCRVFLAVAFHPPPGRGIYGQSIKVWRGASSGKGLRFLPLFWSPPRGKLRYETT